MGQAEDRAAALTVQNSKKNNKAHNVVQGGVGLPKRAYALVFLALLCLCAVFAACVFPNLEAQSGAEIIAPAMEIAPTATAVPEPTPSLVPDPTPTQAPTPTPVPTLDPNGKYIALTYDDGPTLKHTARLLGILKEHEVRVTFFVPGENLASDTAATLVRRAFAEGHEIGSHTWSHMTLTKNGASRIREDLSKANDRIEELTGTRPILLRPPHGSQGATARREAEKAGLSLILWSVDTKDWSHNSASKVLRAVKRGAKPNGIILMHDTHAAGVDATEEMILWLKEKGYTIIPAGELIALRRGLEPGVAYRSGDPVE